MRSTAQQIALASGVEREGAQNLHPMMSTKVYVGELGENGDKGVLEREFERFGTLKSVWVARNPPGFAFVEFEDPRDAEEAIRELDGKMICNVRIKVEAARNRHDGSGGGGRGYSGGGRSRRMHAPPRGYHRDRRSPPRRRSRSPYYSRRSRSRSPYYDHRRSRSPQYRSPPYRSPPYRRSPGIRDDRRMDSRSPSPR